jgi:hypothetical protein
MTTHRKRQRVESDALATTAAETHYLDEKSVLKDLHRAALVELYGDPATDAGVRRFDVFRLQDTRVPHVVLGVEKTTPFAVGCYPMNRFLDASTPPTKQKVRCLSLETVVERVRAEKEDPPPPPAEADAETTPTCSEYDHRGYRRRTLGSYEESYGMGSYGDYTPSQEF